MFLGVCSSFKDAFVFLSINERTLNYTMIVTFLHFQIFLSYRTSLASENSHTPCLHQWFIYLVFIVFVFITIFRIKGKYSNEIRIKLFFFAFMLLSVSSTLLLECNVFNVLFYNVVEGEVSTLKSKWEILYTNTCLLASLFVSLVFVSLFIYFINLMIYEMYVFFYVYDSFFPIFSFIVFFFLLLIPFLKVSYIFPQTLKHELKTSKLHQYLNSFSNFNDWLILIIYFFFNVTTLKKGRFLKLWLY